MSFPEPLIYPATSTHTHTLILLHGRSSNSTEFSEYLFSSPSSPFDLSSSSTNFKNWKFVLPCSKIIYNTSISGPKPAWFDQESLIDSNKNWETQVDGLNESTDYIKSLIEKEVDELQGNSGNVVVMGFSMGCATSLLSLMGYYGGSSNGGKRLGGYVGYGGWLPFDGEVEEVLTEEGTGGMIEEKVEFVKGLLGDVELCKDRLKGTKVFWGHGEDDAWVDVSHGRRAVEVLRRIGVDEVEWKGYKDAEMDGHFIKKPEGVEDIADFLKRLV